MPAVPPDLPLELEAPIVQDPTVELVELVELVEDVEASSAPTSPSAPRPPQQAHVIPAGSGGRSSFDGRSSDNACKRISSICFDEKASFEERVELSLRTLMTKVDTMVTALEHGSFSSLRGKGPEVSDDIKAWRSTLSAIGQGKSGQPDVGSDRRGRASVLVAGADRPSRSSVASNLDPQAHRSSNVSFSTSALRLIASDADSIDERSPTPPSNGSPGSPKCGATQAGPASGEPAKQEGPDGSLAKNAGWCINVSSFNDRIKRGSLFSTDGPRRSNRGSLLVSPEVVQRRSNRGSLLLPPEVVQPRTRPLSSIRSSNRSMRRTGSGLPKLSSRIMGRVSTMNADAAEATGRAPTTADVQQKLQNNYVSRRSVRTEVDHSTALARLMKMVVHPYFDYCIAAVIFLNMLLIGARTQLQAAHGSNHRHRSIFFVAEHTCTAVFLLELLARVFVHRAAFFTCSSERMWNAFDVFLVVVSLVDFVLACVFGESGPSHGVKALRVVRMARLMRVLRTVRFVPTLRLMVSMLFGSLLSLFWVVVIMSGSIYIFSIVLTTGATDFLEEGLKAGGGPQPEVYEDVQRAFGSLFQTMYTLYKAMSGGVDWGDVSVLLGEAGWVYEAIMICYILFMLFALMNVVTGVFVDGAIEFAKRDRTTLTQTQARDMMIQEGHMLSLLQEIDEEGVGQITAEQFELALQRPEIKDYISALKIEIPDVHEFFSMLDQDNSGSVDIVEFVTGMQSLRGEAKRVDIHMMMSENKKTLHMVTGLVDILGLLLDEKGRKSSGERQSMRRISSVLPF